MALHVLSWTLRFCGICFLIAACGLMAINCPREEPCDKRPPHHARVNSLSNSLNDIVGTGRGALTAEDAERYVKLVNNTRLPCTVFRGVVPSIKARGINAHSTRMLLASGYSAPESGCAIRREIVYAATVGASKREEVRAGVKIGIVVGAIALTSFILFPTSKTIEVPVQ